ncbi:MAG TPA: tetratricopeptide repeat protein [Roseiflexaceae bacterium]|nr:tetratricopeptide repeat protein [Roseiflexaceae bacterium]
MDGNASFGYWVRRRRKALDLTQAELARRVGCAEGTIRMIEADARRPSRQIAERLADQLAIAPADRAAFIRAARAELSADRLAPPTQDASRALSPAATHAPAILFSSALPSRTVTFLFTDIVGSTALWEQHPQAMTDLLARHDAILRKAIAAHDGVVFKTVGDAVCAVFASAPAALGAALAAQRALHAEPWGATGPLRVRMALHTGSVEAREGDYAGLPLSRVAQLLAAGHGGQMLLSLATEELVREHLPSGVDLRDLDVHRLTDLTRPEHIFQLVAADLPADFPPLNSLERHRHNLPAQLTGLIGREREVAEVCTLLRTPDLRLLTLTGPGGTGKTRLALQAAVELLGDFQDGVFFVNLAPISDPQLVTGVIAQIVGVRETTGRPLLDRLYDYLHEKRMLLLLDNFEQVSPAAPVIAELLVAAPHLKVLVTSRAVLHLYGEREFAVPPLEIPEHGRFAGLDRLTQYEAVRLFIERAQAVKTDFLITNANAPAVAEICYRLDGLPLAIELAAARVKLLAPQALLERLERRLPLLTGGAQNLPVRQQTLRATIDWSYYLLDADQQALFARLAVFVGGCTIEAAEAVITLNVQTARCEPAEGFEHSNVLDGLAALVDKSLLRQVEGPDGAPRFVMLETIREYALERLVASGEEAELRQGHALYYLALAERAEPLLHGAEQLAWLDQLDAEHDNLRAALSWSQVPDRADVALRLAGALGWFWFVRGYLTEGRAWLADVLTGFPVSYSSEEQGAEHTSAARATALNRAGLLADFQADHTAARALFEEALSISQALGDRRNTARALFGKGRCAFAQEDAQSAAALFESSLVLAREAGEPWDVTIALIHVGWAAVMQGDYERGETWLGECLALCRNQGDWGAMAATLGLLGYAARNQRDYARARVLYEEGLALFKQLGDKWQIANALNNLGNLAWSQGDYLEAAAYYNESLALYREIGDQSSIALSFCDQGYLAHAQGDDTRAAALLAESLALSHDIGETGLIAYCLRGLGGVAVAQGQPERGARLLSVAEALFDAYGHVMNPTARDEHDREVASTREQLGETAFAAAWQAGRGMPLEQAIAYAFDEPA